MGKILKGADKIHFASSLRKQCFREKKFEILVPEDWEYSEYLEYSVCVCMYVLDFQHFKPF